MLNCFGYNNVVSWDHSYLSRVANWIFSNLELYNLKDDYVEQNNILEQNPEKVADLKAKYTTWRSEMGKPMGGDPKKKKKK